jgi:hypothetical protein
VRRLGCAGAACGGDLQRTTGGHNRGAIVAW